jgi:glucosamine--fructose-6-phosphate aminotransferase (isomerizing)
MILKSTHFPNEMVATRRGSPLLIGVKTAKKLKVDFVDVEFGADNDKRKAFTLQKKVYGQSNSVLL